MQQYEGRPNPWIRASDLRLKPLDIRAPVKPLYYRVIVSLFVYLVMYLSLFYLLFAIWYNLVYSD